MRRALEVLALISTTVILIATSRAPDPCAPETVVLLARTSCGPERNVSFTSSTSCTLTVVGSGFPAAGNLSALRPDAGVMEGFDLFGPRVDGGLENSCHARPEDGGLFITCTPRGALCDPDAGVDAGPCELECSGLLTTP